MDNTNLDTVVMDNAITYADNIKTYDEYLNFVAYFVKTLALPENSLSVAMITNMLLKKGIFSKNGEFKYVPAVYSDIEGFLGLNVINGCGNSKNMSAFTCDVLTKLGYTAASLPVRISDAARLEDTSKSANMSLTMVQYKGNMYGYDAINNTFYSFVNGNTLNEVYSDNPLYAVCAKLQDVKAGQMLPQNEYKFIKDYVTWQMNKDNQLLFAEIARYSTQFIEKIINGMAFDKTRTKK